MGMRVDLIWDEDFSISYRSHCDRCRFTSPVLDDEETVSAAWRGHSCS